MKNKLLALLLMVALVCTALFVVACQPEEPTPEYSWPINISNFWAGHEDEETYTIVSGTGGGTGLKISYEKTATWQYAKRSFAYETAEQLAQAKTLVLEGKMVTDTNDPRVTLKIEYTDNTNKEVHFYMSETNAVYEWDLSEAHLENALLLYIFAEGNRVSANGTIELSRIQLTNEAINDANNIEKQTPPAPEVQVNTITADAKTVNAGWYDSGDNVYTIASSGTAYNVEYNKTGFSWAYFYAVVKGDALSTMKTFSITVKGTAGKEIMVKPFDKAEAKLTLTGGEDVISVDLTKVTDVDFTAEQKVLVFAEPNTIDVEGSFQILGAEFSTEQLVPAQEVNTITADAKTVNAGWYDSGDNVYTITKDGTVYNVSFDKGETEWSTFKALVKGEAISTMKTLKVTVKGTEGVEIMVKPFNAVEQRYTLSGGEDVVVVDISGVTAGIDFTTEKEIYIFGAPGVTKATGSFQIISAEFSTDAATVEPDPTPAEDVNTITADATTVNAGWYDGNDTVVYTITKDGTAYNVAYDKKAGQHYANMYALVKGEAIGTMKTFKITLKGTEGKTIIVKPFNEWSLETNHTFTGGEDTVTIDISSYKGDFTAENRIVLMVEGGSENVSGSFQIISAEFSTDAATVEPDPTPAQDVNTITADATTVNAGWYDGNDTVVYTITKDGTAYNVAYDKKAGQHYANMYALVKGEAIGTMKTFKITLKGTEGKTIIVKPFDKVEKTFTFTGNEDTFTVDITGVTGVDFAAENKIVLMVEGGSENVSGSFQIISAEFCAE